jgi:hypothetical protein
MAGVIALPFASTGTATSTITRLPFDSRASVVAIHHHNEYVSLNYIDLKPGDVILFDVGKFDPLVTPAIARYQNRIFGNPDTARWKHVGILDDNFQVWDAMPELNVRVRPLREILVPLSRICIRRSLQEIDVHRLRDSLIKLSSANEYKFSIHTGGALLSRLRARVDQGHLEKGLKSNKVICSMFVANVLRRATLHPYFKKLPIVLPGDFMASDNEFRTVELEWCCIEKPVAPQPDVQPAA